MRRPYTFRSENWEHQDSQLIIFCIIKLMSIVVKKADLIQEHLR